MLWVTSDDRRARSAPRAAAARALNRSRVSASRALNGSSRSRTAGSSASARAIATRWRVPPDRVDGRRAANSRRPTSPSRSSARAAWRSADQPASSSGKRTFASARAPGEQPRLLEDEADPRVRARSPAIAVDRHASRRPARSGPAMTRRSVLLPQPLGPISATTSRGSDVEVDPVEDVVGARAAERERDAVDETPAPGAGTGRRGRGGSWRLWSRSSPSSPCTSVAALGARRCDGARPRRGTHRPRPSSIRTVPSAPVGAASLPSPRICCAPRALPPSRSWARPASRGTLPPVGNCTLPRRLARSLPRALGGT